MTDEELEKLAKRRVQARNGFAVHLAIYVFAHLGMIAIWFGTGRGYPWFVWPLFGWGIGIVAHAIAFFFGPDSAYEDRAIHREVRRLRAQAH